MQGEPPTLIVGADITTLDEARPKARAMLVHGRRILWVGDDPDDAPGPPAETIDLDGATVQPGFVNAHVHMTALGLLLEAVNLTLAGSRADVVASLRAVAPITTSEVVLGAGWDETRWADSRGPTADELSEAVPNRPVLLTRVDGHAVVVDRTTLTALPLSRARGVDRDAEGRPTGLLRKEAAALATRWVTAMLSEDNLAAARRAAAAALARSGYTSVHEMGGPHRAGIEDFDTWREEEWPLEVIGYWGALDLDFVAERGLHRVGGSLLLDGTIGSRSAALHTPYADSADSGQLYKDEDELIAFVREATARGIQVALHAIGDRAVSQAVTALRLTAGQLGIESVRRARHRLEHALLVGTDDMTTLAELGIVVVVHPTVEHGMAITGGAYDRRLGTVRARTAHPIGSMLAAGIPLAFGGDGMLALDPWDAVDAAVAHHVDGQRLTHDQALRAATIGGRVAARQQSVGPLKAGMRADLAAFETRDDGTRRCVLTMTAGRLRR